MLMLYKNMLWIKISETRIIGLSYHIVWGAFFIPLTLFLCLKPKRKSKEEILEHEKRIKKLEKFQRILRLIDPNLSKTLLLKILFLRSGNDEEIIPGVQDCLKDLIEASYVDNERLLRYINDKYPNLAIKGVVYVTKQAFCYLLEREGIVDLPIKFLERVPMDEVYVFAKTGSQWGVVVAGIIGVVRYRFPLLAVLPLVLTFVAGLQKIAILKPIVTPVSKLTGQFIPRISDRKDAIVFDSNHELPPVIAQSLQQISNQEGVEKYRIFEEKLLDVAKASGLKNRFADRIRTKKRSTQVALWANKVEEWAQENGLLDLPDGETESDNIKTKVAKIGIKLLLDDQIIWE